MQAGHCPLSIFLPYRCVFDSTHSCYSPSMIRTLMIAALILLAHPVRADVIGPACVTDGDSISINGKRQSRGCRGGNKVRLVGIDAPELKQLCRHPNGRDFQCGLAAASFLLKQVRDKTVECRGTEKDRYKRLLAECFVGETSLNALMVLEGWALAYRRYSEKYIAQEKEARQNKKGIWGMKFMPPWEWRRGNQ